MAGWSRRCRRSGWVRWRAGIEQPPIAGTIATGAATIEQVCWDIFRLMLDVASGRKKTWADRWGIHNALTLFNPGPVT